MELQEILANNSVEPQYNKVQRDWKNFPLTLQAQYPRTNYPDWFPHIT